MRFSLATIAFDRESAQMSQMLSSQGKNAPSNPYPHYLNGGMKGEVERGKVVGECTGPEGERGGRNEGKRVGGQGSESTLEKL